MSSQGEPSAVLAASRWWRLLLPLTVGAALAVFALRADAATGPSQSTWPEDTRDGSDPLCLRCHGDPQAARILPSGEALSLYVDVEAYSLSVHGQRLACIDCHERNQEYPHSWPTVYSLRDFAVAEYELCKRCHFENYARTLDSTHYDAMAKGNASAPICTDCHTAHTVVSLKQSRTVVVQTCSKCHLEIYQSYAASVHGRALSEENPDVPDCITCHGVHNIAGATAPSFRQASVNRCAGCHGDKARMDKYGISTRVLKSYLDDFHGKTVGFYQKQTSEVWPDVAVCTDCHGVHDIKPVYDPESLVIKENLVATCRRCHANASTNFSAAWLSHYEPSLTTAPLVYLVKQYYRFLIPLMMVGLGLNIALDLWRLAHNR
ncbi:MAG TPA: cytochrome C [Dehalococcoidia bacterium]|nr:cytochrome C [Dehalococcoidia bacterium]